MKLRRCKSRLSYLLFLSPSSTRTEDIGITYVSPRALLIIASSRLERFLVNGKGARRRQSGRARRGFIGVKLHLSELETRFSFVDALITSRSVLVELHLLLNYHLTVVRDLTSRKVVDDKDGRGPELVNYRQKPDFRYNMECTPISTRFQSRSVSSIVYGWSSIQYISVLNKCVMVCYCFLQFCASTMVYAHGTASYHATLQ